MKLHLRSLLLALPFLICVAGVFPPHAAVAQGPSWRLDGPPPDNAKTRMWLLKNMVKYLKLDDSAEKRFQPIFLDYQEKRSKLMQEHFEVTRKISAAVDNDLSPITEMQTLVQRYKVINRSLYREKERFLKRSEEVLDARQMVKLTIYEDKMKEELFKRMRKDNHNMPGGTNTAPPGLMK